MIYGPSPCHVVFAWSNHPVILVSFYFVLGMSMFASICAPCLHHVVFATYKISFIGVSISLKRCFCQVQNLCDQRSSPPSRRFGELQIPVILDCVNFVVWHVRIPCQLRSIPVSRRLHMSASGLPCPCPLYLRFILLSRLFFRSLLDIFRVLLDLRLIAHSRCFCKM